MTVPQRGAFLEQRWGPGNAELAAFDDDRA
jgi:hypothetical protein